MPNQLTYPPFPYRKLHSTAILVSKEKQEMVKEPPIELFLSGYCLQ